MRGFVRLWDEGGGGGDGRGNDQFGSCEMLFSTFSLAIFSKNSLDIILLAEAIIHSPPLAHPPPSLRARSVRTWPLA